ncbi:MAG TPA: DUF2235 domain-containing protein [Planctomycetota bacterium]|nr:DUF2235 domain-containing protein [Planctomycetota bacterium]
MPLSHASRDAEPPDPAVEPHADEADVVRAPRLVAAEDDVARMRRVVARHGEATTASEQQPADPDIARHHSIIEGAAPVRLARLAPAWDEARPKPSEMGAWTWSDGAWQATAPRDGIAPPEWTRPGIDGGEMTLRLPLDKALMLSLDMTEGASSEHVSPGVAAAVAAAIGRGELAQARAIGDVVPLMEQMTASRTLDVRTGEAALAARDGVPERVLAAKVDTRPSAHFAFDGTRNHGLSETNFGGTNVFATHLLLSRNAQGEENPHAHYYAGPGNDIENGLVGHIVGGATGIGGGSALDRALEDLKRDYADGIRVVDITGFSRGAALAPEFMQRAIEWQNAERKAGKTVDPIEFRFVGLYDMVPATGYAKNDINFGLRFDVPDGEYSPKHVVHVIAGAENRDAFQVKDIGSVYDDNLAKPILNAAHSDAGGGYRHKGISNIVLHHMLEQMQRTGVPIDSLERRVARGDASLVEFVHQDPYMIPHREQSVLYTQIDRRLPRDITRHVTLGDDWTPPSIVRVEVEPPRSPKGGIAERNEALRVFSRKFADSRETKDQDHDYQRYGLDEIP